MLNLSSLDTTKKEDVIALKRFNDSLKNPAIFTQAVFGDSLWSGQAKIAKALEQHAKVSVRSCHGIGKTHLGSRIALRYLNQHPDSIVITTAPTWRQVEQQMWRYMRGAYNKSKSRLPLAGRMLKTRYEIDTEWYALGVSSDDTDRIQGFHSASGDILVIVDEAAGVDEATFVAVEAIMVSMNARLLLLGNPTSVSGTFRASHESDPSFYKMAISCFDTPNFTNNGIENLEDLRTVDLENVEITHPYLITPHWAKDKITRWGVESPDFQSRVLGQFPDSESNTIIPVNLIEAATTEERLMKLTNDGHLEQPHRAGVDVARYGDDETTIYGGRGGILETEEIAKRQSTTMTAKRVSMLPNSSYIGVDADGVGGGVVDTLNDDRITGVFEIHNGSKPIKDGSGITFVNLKSQMWYYAKQQFEQGNVYIPPSMDILTSQLASVRFKATAKGWAVEGKDETKKRLHRSPDRAEGYVYWLFGQMLGAVAERRDNSIVIAKRDDSRISRNRRDRRRRMLDGR